MKDLKPNYRILVLTNFKRSRSHTFPMAIELAKLVHGAIDVFGVQSVKGLNSESNQVRVLRDLKTRKKDLELKLKRRVEKWIKEQDIPMIYNAQIGNPVEAVREHIELTQPDIVVLGNHKRMKSFWHRAQLLQTVLKYHKGLTMITRSKRFLVDQNSLGLGFIDQFLENHPMMQTLLKKTKGTHRLFQFSSGVNAGKSEHSNELVTYYFDTKLGSHSNFSKYIENDHIQLLCIKKQLLPTEISLAHQKRNLIKTLSHTETPILVFPN